MAKNWAFIGTSTGGESRGIYRATFDSGTGEIGPVGLAAEAPNPTFLVLHPNGRHLYAVNAIADFNGEKTGSVSAFTLDRQSGELTLLNRQPSGGTGPCHLALDRTAACVLVANYSGGSVAVLPIAQDGGVEVPTSMVQHHGSSVDPRRQEGPHAHSINVSPDNRFALAADLGLDQILIYRLDPGDGTLTPSDPSSGATAAGAGPRHFAFHPSGRFGYVINELDSTVTAFAYEAETGALTEIQAISTLPEGFSGENYPAEIQVHPSGRFLYGSNRGHDSIAVFRIDEATGRLTAAGHQPSGGIWPRNFLVDETGRWMIVGNQNTNNIRVFSIDAETGTLTDTGQEQQAPAPICFKLLPVE